MATKKTASEKYGYYLERLDKLSGKDYMLVFVNLYGRILNENEDKIKKVLGVIKDSDIVRDHLGTQAIDELMPYYKELIQSLSGTDLDSDSRYWIDFVEGATSGKDFLYRDGLADLLFDTVRILLEKYCRVDGLNENILCRLPDGKAYVDWDLVRVHLPHYHAFSVYNKNFELTRDKEPWGDYVQLNYFYNNGNGFGDEEINALKHSIQTHLLKFLSYLDSEDDIVERLAGEVVVAEIKNLFQLKKSPDGIHYRGIKKDSSKFKKSNSRSQPYATLLLATEKYKRQRYSEASNVILSYTEIETRLSNIKYCHRPLMTDSYISRKRKLDLLLSNILKKVSFTKDEAYVSGDTNSDSPKLNFEVRKNK